METVWQFLQHLWAPTPINVAISCPIIDGQPVDPQGFVDVITLATAWNIVSSLSVGLVLVGVVACYNMTQMTLGAGFTRRWLFFALATSAICAGVAYATLHSYPFYSAADSCDTNPQPFRVNLPTQYLIARTIAGLIWGMLAFLTISILFTKSVGRFPWGGGFFHNRGTPVPRFPLFGSNH